MTLVEFKNILEENKVFKNVDWKQPWTEFDQKPYAEKIAVLRNNSYNKSIIVSETVKIFDAYAETLLTSKDNINCYLGSLIKKDDQQIKNGKANQRILLKTEIDGIREKANQTQEKSLENLTDIFLKKFNDKKNEKNTSNSKSSKSKSKTKSKSADLTGILEQEKAVILYGPPGTGKTQKARKAAEELVENNTKNEDVEYITFVQFHPGYSYNDFMENIDVSKKEIAPKIFKKLAETARNDPDNKFVLIIDEINRANVAEVLGELLFGLEYRGSEVTTQLSNEQFSVPENLYIIGTMNTADRSLQPLDLAVRRRFAFFEVPAEAPEKNDVSDKVFMGEAFSKVKKDITDSVARGVEARDIMPGVSYFLVNEAGDDPDGRKHFEYKLDYELIPLLKEYIKDGMFTKRKHIDGEKSLIELVQSGEYRKKLKDLGEGGVRTIEDSADRAGLGEGGTAGGTEPADGGTSE